MFAYASNQRSKLNNVALIKHIILYKFLWLILSQIIYSALIMSNKLLLLSHLWYYTKPAVFGLTNTCIVQGQSELKFSEVTINNYKHQKKYNK